MALTAAICTQCGAQIQVDESKDAGICPSCGTAFITEKVIHQFVTQNNFAGATINVQGGVDIENLYTLARRAVDSNNTDDVIKYYGQIREREPDDWEATFFYAWFSNSENFNADFKITQDLILKLEPQKQVDALHKVYNFFKKNNFKIGISYGSYEEKTPFPLKNEQLLHDFIMDFFDAKNPDVVDMAGYLTNFLSYPNKFYYEILSRQDKFYTPYLQKFKIWIYRNFSRKDDSTNEWKRIINEVEKDIEKLNFLLDSDEDKKNNYLDYYIWLVEDFADRLTVKNIENLKCKILVLNPSYTFPDNMKSNIKQKLSTRNKKIFSMITSVVYAVLSYFGGKYLYHIDSDDEIVKTILIALGIANVLSLFMSFKYDGEGKKVLRIIIKTLIVLVLAFILFCIIYEHFFLKQ